jgi:tetratricopeptide (TPR) repeat protein
MVSRLPLVVALASAASALAAGPAAAQRTGPTFTREEYTALAAAEAALAARNYPAAAAAVAAAQAAARGSDARYHAAALQLRLGRDTGNLAAQASAVEALIASGRVQGAELGALYAVQGAAAANAGQRERADAALTRALELAPSAETAISLARVKLELRRNADAVALVGRAVDLRRAAGQPVPQAWLKRGATIATSADLWPQAVRFARELAAAYPSPENWRDAILVWRDAAKPDAAGQLDSARLMRLAKGLAGERDYLETAQIFASAGLMGESRSVLDEGVAARMIDPAKPTFKEAIAASVRGAAAEKARLAGLQTAAMAAATGSAALQAGDLFLGNANYAGAVDLFRAAIQKGGVDPAVANIRLGTALALAGRRAEADAAFAAVTGPRAELAALWRAWLAQRA